MNKIDARSKTIRELLSGTKYSIDYYQREYKWQTKNISELLEDLETKFLENYKPGDERSQVERYGHYFLGSIVINQESVHKYIIDGQQRLTSLTLLLIYLYHLQQDRPEQVKVNDLIFSEKYGTKSYNLDVTERTPAIDAIYGGRQFDVTEQTESVQNIVARYQDIADEFPDSLQDAALPYFIDWLLDNVEMVEITAFSDDDAYTIFETMNDRGLSLSPTDMLKGYLLASIDDPTDKEKANKTWKEQLLELTVLGKEEESDFFKAWLRAKYADTIRERKKGAVNEDFERIGTTFHKWLIDKRVRIGLTKSADFYEFVEYRFARFNRHYRMIRSAAGNLTPSLEYVFYNAHNNFTLQTPLLLAPLLDDDDQDTVTRKIRLVSGYIDIFISRRIWNFRTLGYSSIVYTMFNLMKEIRNKSVAELAIILQQKVQEMGDTFAANDRLRLHQQNRQQIHYLLARITNHIEEQAGEQSSFTKYIRRDVSKPFEIEHIWADKFERHQQEFAHPRDFDEYRNRIGDLVLLPRGFNQSLNDLPYEEKAPVYATQNLLLRSLTEQGYQNNPSFRAYIQRSSLPFRAYKQFTKLELDQRQDLYRRIAEEIWSPIRFDQELS